MKENKFKIIVPLYNAENYIEHCISTILQQTYKNYEMIVINDASTDNSKEKIENIRRKIKFKVIHREENVGALRNIVEGIEEICNDPEDIIIIIDGDDSLYSVDVFEKINNIYQNENIWLTYGNYIDRLSNRIGCNKEIIDTRTYRRKGLWCTSHLRTFKWHLWKGINIDDLKDINGNYYMSAYDNAILFPMIEMASKKRIKFVNDVLYLYNNENPINDHKKDLKLQLDIAMEIRRKPLYEEIP